MIIDSDRTMIIDSEIAAMLEAREAMERDPYAWGICWDKADYVESLLSRGGLTTIVRPRQLVRETKARVEEISNCLWRRGG